MSGDFGKVATAMAASGAALRAATKAATVEATSLVTSLAVAGQGRAGASSGRLRGVGKRGAAIGVIGSVQGLTGVVRAYGPAHLLDHPTRPHGGHPGTKGKPYFEDAVESALPAIDGIFQRATTEAVVDGVRGLI